MQYSVIISVGCKVCDRNSHSSAPSKAASNSSLGRVCCLKGETLLFDLTKLKVLVVVPLR